MKAEVRDDDVLQQAAEWFARLNAPSVQEQERRAWRVWLAADQRHGEAWARVEAIERRFQGLAPGPARKALGAAGQGRRRAVLGLTALALGGPLLWGTWRSEPLHHWRAEGSEVWLNTDSALNVRYHERRRELELVAGDINIRTAPDVRPMEIITSAGLVRPLGTRFSLSDRGDGVLVRVFEGRVAVLPRHSAETVVLSAGRQGRFSARAAGEVRRLDEGAEPWVRGMLRADNMRLDDFLAQLGRYRHGVIRCAEAVAGLRLVGAYPVDDTDRVLQALERTLPVRVERLTDWWVTVRGR